LATYRTFTDTLTVIRLIKRRYEQIQPASLEMTEDVRLACLKSLRTIIETWLNEYLEDFNEMPPFAFTNLRELKKVVRETFRDDQLIRIIDQKTRYLEGNSDRDTVSSGSKQDLISSFISTSVINPRGLSPSKHSLHSKSNSTSTNFYYIQNTNNGHPSPHNNHYNHSQVQ
jgi:hypothetical protein